MRTVLNIVPIAKPDGEAQRAPLRYGRRWRSGTRRTIAHGTVHGEVRDLGTRPSRADVPMLPEEK